MDATGSRRGVWWKAGALQDATRRNNNNEHVAASNTVVFSG
jgi:hypothetical protein